MLILAWVNSVRLWTCLLAGLQVVVAFRVAGTSPPWLAVAAVCCITGATKLQNDWRDRHHDLKKGKRLAITYPLRFLVLLLTAWCISAGVVLLAATENNGLGIAFAAMAIVGLTYSETRRIPMAPVLVVSLTAASPSLLPAVAGANVAAVLPLFAALSLIVFGRGITKDLDDAAIDRGYKWTIPVAWGNQRARVVATATMLLGLAILLKVSLLTLPGSLIAIGGTILLIRGKNPSVSRRFLDVGMAMTLLLLTILESPPQLTPTN